DLEREVDALGDVGGLLVDRRDHAAGLAVDAEGGVVVADVEDRLPHDVGDGDVGLGGDLPRHHDQAGREQRLARHPALRVLGQDGVEDGVGDLVRHLVGVALGDRLRCERPLRAHDPSLVRWATTASRTTLATARLSISGMSTRPPSARNSTARLVSCSNPASGAETSLATTRSTPLAASLAAACSATRSVSAAKPTSV